MKHATIEIDEDLAEALEVYGQEHGLTGTRDAVAQAALRELLAVQGDLIPFRPFRVTPLHRDDGPTDVSINHDRYLVESWQEGGSR